ncbi:High mobility group B protein 13 [Camellia lanceoleosa]|uniref:High mobility group B protein 13 n=1 Tax=Camellia lanceoleosa TaxID=1840588 RepID=A0ACC0HTW0_9ERIC|nr:High mobility group B protein 13 [Camellia lanceoleosa]
MSSSLAFTTEAMKLLEEEQFLQLKPKQPISVFFMFRNKRRAESKNGWEVIEEWNNMTEKRKKPYEKVQLTLSLSLNLSLSVSATTISYFGNLQIAKQNMEKYLEEMEAYKQRTEEEFANPKIEEDEMMKIHKLDKKKQKTDNIIIKKMKENRQKKKKIADPNKLKKPASLFLLFNKEARKNLLEERSGINDSTLNALILVKWKVTLIDGLAQSEDNVFDKSPNGQVISPVEVIGYVVVVDKLLTIQNNSYGQPTILVAKFVKGEEDILDGAVAVLIPDMPDVLSHISMRARNSKKVAEKLQLLKKNLGEGDFSALKELHKTVLDLFAPSQLVCSF